MSAIDATKPTAGTALTADVRANFLAAKNEIDANTASAAAALSAANTHAARTDNPHTLTAAQVGLGSVDNTADLAKPVSTAQQTALNLKANLASPTFTGTVGLPAGQAINGVTLSTVAGTSAFLRGDGTYAAASGGGGGTVTAVSVTAANGITGTVATATTTPAITLALGAITPTTVVASGAVSGSNLSGSNTGDNAANTTYSGLVSNATHTGDATGATALVLATVNGNVGSFTNASVTVNAKGLITAIANGSVGLSDMVLATAQTVTGAKTFNAATLLLNNVAGTFASLFTNTNTAARTYTLKDASGTVAFISDITGTNSGTNTGDQTNIAGNAGTVTTNANLTGPVTSTGNATAIAAGAITNAMLANAAVANLSGTNTGDNASNTQYSGLVSATWATPGAIGSTTPNTGAFTTLSATGTATINSITLSGNISAPAWTTAGLRFRGIPATLTDTTSTGTVPIAYTDSFGGNTIAATSATTFTNYLTAQFKDPIAGTNATMTSKWALGADSFRAGSTGQFSVSNAGVVTLPAGQAVNGVTLTNAGLATNFLTAAGTYVAAGGGAGDFKSDGTVSMTGAISTTVGTMTSTVVNSATAKGFTLNTPAYSTGGAKLLSLQNNSVEKAYVELDGTIRTMGGFLAQGRIGNTWSFIAQDAATANYGWALENVGTVAKQILISGGIYSWVSSATNALAAPDTALGRNAAGVVEANNGTAGAFRDLKLRNLITSAGLIATDAAAPTLASAAVIAPTTSIAFVSGVVAINTITAPAPIASGGGQITLIPTGIFSTTTAGNIALATTAIVSRALTLTYDVTTGKWYPSY